MRQGLLPLALLLAAALLAGCFGEERSPVDVAPYLPQHDVEPGGSVLVPFFLNSTQTFKQDLGVGVPQGELPAGWSYRLPVKDVTLPGFKGRFVVVEFLVPADAAQGPEKVGVLVGKTRGEVSLNVKPLGAPARAATGVNLTWIHLDANGTILAHAEPLLRADRGLLFGANATRGEPPVLAYLGAPGEEGVPEAWASAGYRRLPAALEARLADAKVGQTLLVDAAPPPDPFAGEAAGGHRLLLRVVGAQAQPPQPEEGQAAEAPSAEAGADV